MMYAVTDTTGLILRTGFCTPDVLQAQAGKGELVFELQEQVRDSKDMINVDTGEVLHDARPARQLSYRQLRAKAYPPIKEQLDAMWKALAALEQQGVSLGTEGTEMLASVTEVKTQYPKETTDETDTDTARTL